MGVLYFWFLGRVTQAEYEGLCVPVKECLEKCDLQPDQEKILAAWKRSAPLSLQEQLAQEEDVGGWKIPLSHLMHNLFLPEPFHDFAWEHILTTGTPFLYKADSRDFKMVGLRQGSPAAVFAFAIGFERFQTLPGRSFCFCLSPQEVVLLRQQVDAFFVDPIEQQAMRARELACLRGADPGVDEELDEMLSTFPSLLAAAEEEGHGLISFEFHVC